MKTKCVSGTFSQKHSVYLLQFKPLSPREQIHRKYCERVEGWQRREILQIVWWWRALCRILICWKSPVIICAQTALASQSSTPCVLLIDVLCSWGLVCLRVCMSRRTLNQRLKAQMDAALQDSLSQFLLVLSVFFGRKLLHKLLYLQFLFSKCDWLLKIFLHFTRKSVCIENWSWLFLLSVAVEF